MKKLGKLNLMKEKMLSHEELVSFRGGSGNCGKCSVHTTWSCYKNQSDECMCAFHGETCK